MDDYARQVYLDAVGQLRLARTGDRRAEIVKTVKGRLGVSLATAYRNLQALGWESGRKERTDKGTSVVTPEAARQVARLCARGRDNKGRPQMPVVEAVEVVASQGLMPADVSPSTVLRVLNATGLGPRQMGAPEAGGTRVSLYPNHVWFVDVSPCIQWYFRDDKGKYLDQYSDGAARFYAGKPQNFPKKKLLRYLVTDHYSGAYFAWYVYSEGENSLDMVDFLWRCFAPKKNQGAFPLRGLPKYLVMDQGPAGKSALVQNLLKALNIELQLHEAGNAKASGSVESRHYAWQRRFESRLAAIKARDLEQVNTLAEQMAAVHNSRRPHSRHGQPPMAIWARITREQLREAPPRDLFFQLAAASPRTGVLTNRLWLRADGRTWQIRGDNLYASQRVAYRLSPFLDQGIRVWSSSGVELAAAEVAFNEAGFPTQGARTHTWDDAANAGTRAPLTSGQELMAHVAAGTEPVELPDLFAGLVEDMERQHYLTASATPWAGTTSELAAPLLLSRVEALSKAAELLGRWLDDAEIEALSSTIGDGCTEADLTAAVDELAADAPTHAANLRVVS